MSGQRVRHRALGLTAHLLVVALLAGLLVAIPAREAEASQIRCDGVLPVGAGGGNSTYSLGPDARLWAWGSNWSGQVGDGTTTDRWTPRKLSGANLNSLVSVAAGDSFALALRSDGTVWSWGHNAWGQLGDGTTTDRTSPKRVEGLSDVKSIFTGSHYAFAIKRDGTVWGWGRNERGMLGDGTTTDRLVPTQIPALTGVTAIAGGGWMTLALKADGTVLSFGYNGTYNTTPLGRGGVQYKIYPTPGLVRGPGGSGFLTGVKGIATSRSVSYIHSVVVKHDGTVWSWGAGCCGQLGNGSSASQPYPTQVTGLPASATAVSAGGLFSLARLSNGQVWSWGANFYGELGNSNAWTYEFSPIQVQGLSSITAVDAGGSHSIALRSNGRSYTWGWNAYGGIGDTTTTHRSSPYQITSHTQAKPATPTDLAAVAGEELAYLTYTPPGSVVTQYVATPYVSGTAQTPVETGMPDPSVAVMNLSQGTTYSFRVTAQNCLGSSSPTAHSNRVVPTGVQLGEDGFKIEGTRLTDRLTLNVNAFNGNVALHASDLRIAGTGIDLNLSRTYNNRSSDTSSSWGARWSSSLGAVRLQFLSGGSILFHAPGGGQLGFAKNDDGTYESPPGMNATLTLDDGGTPSDPSDDLFHLTENATYERLTFHPTTGKLLEAKDRSDNTMTYTYGGPGGAISKITDTQGRETTFSYNAQGRVETVTDPASRTYTYTYDGSGNLVSYTDPAGGENKLAYNGSGNLTAITTPAGRRVELVYDASRRVTSLEWALAPGSPTTSFSYEQKLGGYRQTVVTDARGNETTYDFDPVGNTTGVTDALGNSASLDYTSRSNIRQYTSSGGGTTSFGYSSVHALNSIKAPTGATDSMQYDDSRHPHLPTRITDPQGNEITFAYDAEGNVVSLENQLSSENRVELDYNSDGTLAEVAGPKSTVSFGYDAKGNPTNTTPPAPLGTLSLSYDALSRVTSITDGEGQTTTFTYDPLDRVTRIVYADGSSVAYTYDLDGNLTRMTDPSGVTTMTYDAMGRMVSRQTPDQVDQPVTYGYDAVGNLTRVRHEDTPAFDAQYSYNQINLAETVSMNSVANGLEEIASFTYDTDYNRTSIVFANGITQTFAYDESGRVTNLGIVRDGKTLRAFQYEYERNGTDTALRHTITETRPPEQRTLVSSYSYDRLNRLVSAETNDSRKVQSIQVDLLDRVVEDAYTYDGAGNRLSRTKTIERGGLGIEEIRSEEATYNTADQLVERTARWKADPGGELHSIEETFTYDANGSIVGSDEGASYEYTASGQTKSITPRLDRGLEAAFTYLGGGQTERKSMTVRDACDAATCPLKVTRFLDTVLGLSAQRTSDSHETFIRDSRGGLLMQRSWDEAGKLKRDLALSSSGFANYYFLLDGVGSVIGLADDEGEIVASYTYDPFGEVVEASGDAHLTPYRFTSAYQDPTGLLKMGERYYDPTLGRFTQQDPIWDPLDPKLWNTYVYVGNDPINFRDPTGMSPSGDQWRSFFGCGWREFSGITFDWGGGGGSGGGGGASWAIHRQKVGDHFLAMIGFGAAKRFFKREGWKGLAKIAGRASWLVTAYQVGDAGFKCRGELSS